MNIYFQENLEHMVWVLYTNYLIYVISEILSMPLFILQKHDLKKILHSILLYEFVIIKQ